MANEIDALLNVKDASGVLNEIYPITKKENVQGLAELVSNAVSGKADKTALGSYLPKSGGTMTGNLTLNGAPAADLQAATKKYVDDKAPLIFNLSDINSSEGITNVFTALGSREKTKVVLLYDEELFYYITQYDESVAVFSAIQDEYIYTITILCDGDGYERSHIKLTPISSIANLSSTGWTASGSVYTQTATVSGVSATETAQEIHVTPATASMSAYMEAGVYASAQAANKITFTASKKPTVNLTVYAVIRTL